jgi:hypothetical protein
MNAPVPQLPHGAAKAVKKSDRAGAKHRRIEQTRKDRKGKWWKKLGLR